MKVVFFLLGLAHVLILFASALTLAAFIVKRVAARIGRTFSAEPAAPKPAARRQRFYTGPLTVRLPQQFRN